MGSLAGNLLLTILAILLPPVAAFIKVNICHSERDRDTKGILALVSGRLHNAFLDQCCTNSSRRYSGYHSCFVSYLGRSVNSMTQRTHIRDIRRWPRATLPNTCLHRSNFLTFRNLILFVCFFSLPTLFY